MTKTAIIAGSGALPRLVGQALEQAGEGFVIAQMRGYEESYPDGWAVEVFAVERLALLFDRLADLGVERVVFAGAAHRPALDPEQIDPKTAMLLPRILPAMQQGDDGLLRAVIGLFEEFDFAVVGAVDVASDLVPQAGVLTAAHPSEADQKDAARAAEIVSHMGALDLGQGAVVAQGLCLAVETLPGTAAMLAFVAESAGGLRANPKGAKGVIYKAPKPSQDRRIDLPAIGPDTVYQADAAGLAGIVIEAGGVMILDRAATVAAADEAGLFIWARDGAG